MLFKIKYTILTMKGGMSVVFLMQGVNKPCFAASQGENL